MPNPTPIIGAHLDLKYIMPRKEYLHRWLREIAEFGVNTLLLEYEDKFPFSKYPFLRAEEAFTPEELRSFLHTARDAGIQVIPLVQTLSHLEFALAHEELAHLREAPDILTQINPSNSAALQFVHEMIHEVLAYHQEDTYFHLGADETWFVGTHPDYADEVKELGVPAYWVKHMKPYIEKIILAGKRPLVWDDVFWNDPAAITNFDLPRETMLVSWDYTVGTEMGRDNSLSRVDIYRAAGFEVLGGPCLNWGVFVPMHDHVLQNMAAWAVKAKESNLAGLINTSWTVFHTPYSTQLPYNAATADLMRTVATKWTEADASDFCERFFGVRDDGWADALRKLGTNWEQSIEGLGRPLTPVAYGYMDLVLHFGSQQNRMKSGVYPLNWDDVDFVDLYLQKLALLRGLEDQAVIATKLSELETTYAEAMTELSAFAQRVTKRHREAELLACFARMKHLHVLALQFLLQGSGDAKQLYGEFAAYTPHIEACLLPCHEDGSVQRLLGLWWEPALAALATASVPVK